MKILRRIYNDDCWKMSIGTTVRSAVFQLCEWDGLYYWVRADNNLQQEDVPILKLDQAFISRVRAGLFPGNYCRYAFLAKDEHFE